MITHRLVVSYTTFSPLPHTRRGGCFLLPTPAVADSFYFRKWSVLCRPDFPLATKDKRQTGALLSDCKINKFKRKTAHTDLFLLCIGGLTVHNSTFFKTTAPFFKQQAPFLNNKHLFLCKRPFTTPLANENM